MSTADLISAAVPVLNRPAWAEDTMSVRVHAGDVAGAAKILDQQAELHRVTIGEVCRVKRGDAEVVFARASITQAIADLTDRVTAVRVITQMDKRVNKFSELASRSAALRKQLEDRADALAKRFDALPAMAEAAFKPHEALADETERGFKEMEDALRDLAGHNGGPLQDTSKLSGFTAPEHDAA